MIFVIRSTDTGKYVSQQGEKRSYTRDIRRARVYPTEKAAKDDLCRDNEAIEGIQ